MIDITHVTNLVAEVAAESSGKPSGGVVGLLGLNWKLFAAQLINFALVVFVLWKWVFNPVTNALEKRTKKIEESLAGAEKVKKQLNELEDYKQDEQKKARADYQKMLVDAEKAANQQKTKILAEAKFQSEKLVAEAEKRIAEERNAAMKELKGQFAEFVVLAAEKVIAEKMDKAKDSKFISETLKNLK